MDWFLYFQGNSPDVPSSAPGPVAVRHLMKQFSHPAIRHGGNDDTGFFAVFPKVFRHVTPMRSVANQAMRRFDQDHAQQFVAGFDQAAGRRFAGTGIVAGTQRTKVSELLAGAETVETSDQRTHRCRRTDGREFSDFGP